MKTIKTTLFAASMLASINSFSDVLLMKGENIFIKPHDTITFRMFVSNPKIYDTYCYFHTTDNKEARIYYSTTTFIPNNGVNKEGLILVGYRFTSFLKLTGEKENIPNSGNQPLLSFTNNADDVDVVVNCRQVNPNPPH